MPSFKMWELHRAFGDAISKHSCDDAETVLVVLAEFHTSIIASMGVGDKKIKELYSRMAEAAIIQSKMVIDGYSELQAETNPTQSKKSKKARETAGNESGPFGAY